MIGAALSGQSPSEASEPAVSALPSSPQLLAAARRAYGPAPEASDAAPRSERRDRFELDQVPGALRSASRDLALRSDHPFAK